ncbi:putative ABC-type transport system, ATPase component, partial [Gilliamella apicola SCGC AB-598-I20]
ANAGKKTVWHTLRHQVNRIEQEQMEEILLLIGLMEMRNESAAILSHGQKQWLELGMLLMQKPQLLLVDEPVAGMTTQEMDKTAELLNSLAGKHTLVVVEHDMDFVRQIAKTVSVLHQGSILAEGNMEQVQNNPKVIEVYLGQSTTGRNVNVA